MGLPARALAPAALLLSLPLSAAELQLSLKDSPALPWFALMTGTEPGVCETKLAPVRAGEKIAALGELETAEKCGRIVVFVPGHPPTVLEAPFGDKVNPVGLRDREPMRLRVWVLTCRGDKGGACAPGDQQNHAKRDAELDVEHAFYQYALSLAGIAMGESVVTDIHEAPEARALEAKLAALPKGEGLDCSDFSINSLPEAMRPGARNALNVFYVSRSGGLGCPPQADSPDLIQKAGLVIVPVGRSTEDLLSHEIGHVMLSDDSHHPDPTNVMSNAQPLMRCNFDLEQAYLMHFKQNYRLHRAEPGPENPLPEPVTLCQTAECRAAARVYPFACPQEATRALTDWVRCLHCPIERPPKLTMPENCGRFISGLKFILGGQLRVADRLMLSDGLTEQTNWIIEKIRLSFLGKLLLVVSWDFLREKMQLRAAAALQLIDKPCAVQDTAIEALKWALAPSNKRDSEAPRLSLKRPAGSTGCEGEL